MQTVTSGSTSAACKSDSGRGIPEQEKEGREREERGGLGREKNQR